MVEGAECPLTLATASSFRLTLDPRDRALGTKTSFSICTITETNRIGMCLSAGRLMSYPGRSYGRGTDHDEHNPNDNPQVMPRSSSLGKLRLRRGFCLLAPSPPSKHNREHTLSYQGAGRQSSRAGETEHVWADSKPLHLCGESSDDPYFLSSPHYDRGRHNAIWICPDTVDQRLLLFSRFCSSSRGVTSGVVTDADVTRGKN